MVFTSFLLRQGIFAIAAIFAAACIFSAMPAFAANTIESDYYRDSNGNGTVEKIEWNMDEDVTVCTYEASDWTVNTAGSITVVITGLSCASDVLTITVTADSLETGGSTAPVISYNNTDGDNSVTLTSGAMTAKASQTVSDGAAPQMKRIDYKDVDIDGKIDTMEFSFTESLAASSILKASHLSLTTDGDFNDAAFGPATTDLVTATASSVAVTMGTEASVVDTIEDSGTIALSSITGDGTYALIDAAANSNTSAKAQTQVTFLDQAGPVLIDTTPNRGLGGVTSTTDVVLTFSEPIALGNVDIALYPSVSESLTWSVGDTVVTIDGVIASGYNSVTIVYAEDANSATFAGAQSDNTEVSSPLVFFGAGSSSSSTDEEDTETYDITLTAPNGGESYLEGEEVAITWTASGSAMTSVDLSYSYVDADGVTRTASIADGVVNDGSYWWTVPSIASDEVTLQVVGTDLVSTLATDVSDEAFSIGYLEDDTVGTGVSPVTGEEEMLSSVRAGMYIRGASFSTVYYIDSGLARRPFMDAQTYMTYQNNWNAVITVSDATLPTLTLGAPMLPKAGTVLIKIQSDARVYALGDNGELRWITSEAIAEDMYGTDWSAYVIDVPVTLFPRFTRGEDITAAEDVDTDSMKTRHQVNG